MDELRLKLLQSAFNDASKKVLPPFERKKYDNYFPFLHSGSIYCGMSSCIGHIKLDCSSYQWKTICDIFSSLGLDVLSDVVFQDYSEYDTIVNPASYKKL